MGGGCEEGGGGSRSVGKRSSKSVHGETYCPFVLPLCYAETAVIITKLGRLYSLKPYHFGGDRSCQLI